MVKLKPKHRKHIKKAKKVLGIALKVWEIIVVIILSAILIPLFVKNSEDGHFYTIIIVGSMLVYALLFMIKGRIKKQGFIRDYLESTSLRLLLAMSALTAAFLLLILDQAFWSLALVVLAAIAYAFFVQRVGFLRMVGL